MTIQTMTITRQAPRGRMIGGLGLRMTALAKVRSAMA
jgi:hypothetical protein